MRGSAVRVGVIGAGFWARFQVAAWHEVPYARVVAVADCDRRRAADLAAEWRIEAVYASVDELLAAAAPDVVDVVTPPQSHRTVVERVAAAGVPVICQKPLAPTLREAEELAAACELAGVPLLVHENFRWQAPVRALKAALDAGEVGRPFRARLSFSTAFPVFANQPGLRDLDQLILADLGVHLLDVARFLFGEVGRVYAQTATVAPGVAGEDVATVMLTHDGGCVTVVELSFSSIVERDCFPQTLALVEAERGSLELAPDYELRATTASGTRVERCAPASYGWADPAYAVVHASMVPCLANLADSLRGRGEAESAAHDNLRTLSLMAAAYESAASGSAVAVGAGVATA